MEDKATLESDLSAIPVAERGQAPLALFKSPARLSARKR